MATKPQAVEYKIQTGHVVVLDDPKKLVTMQGYPCISGGQVKVNGKVSPLFVRYDNKPELAAQVETWKANWAAYEAGKATEFERNVPGLAELEAAKEATSNEEARYEREFNRAMDSEGGFSPKSVDSSLRARANELSKVYPRAAMYLRAKNYTYASNYKKAGAGSKAMELIATGGSLEEAEAVLKNWVGEFVD